MTGTQGLIEILIGIIGKIATLIGAINTDLGTINIMIGNLKNRHLQNISQNMTEMIELLTKLKEVKETQFSKERIGLKIHSEIKKNIHKEIHANNQITNGEMIEVEVPLNIITQVMKTVDMTQRKIILQMASKMITLNRESTKNQVIILMLKA